MSKFLCREIERFLPAHAPTGAKATLALVLRHPRERTMKRVTAWENFIDDGFLALAQLARDTIDFTRDGCAAIHGSHITFNPILAFGLITE